MFIVMHCMGMPFNGSTIGTESLGGSETAAYYIAKELAAAGHAVTLFTSHPEQGEWDGVRYLYCGEQSEQYPLGFNWHFYATSTPHDVCIIQRHPKAFAWKWASKINIWWLHDLALYRQQGLVQSMLWNVDKILTVSEYHKAQVVDVYDIEPSLVETITNGIDLSLFGPRKRKPKAPYHLLYSSRPERGLEYLVKDGGIMDKLGKDYHLNVCAYENTTAEAESYYKWLYQQVEYKGNVTNIGALTKAQLADLMLDSDLLAYPTTFEEVSCITAMEAMAAGLPMISSRHAALPETCGDGSVLIPLEDELDESAFTKTIKRLCKEKVKYATLSKRQLERSHQYSWENAAAMLLDIIDETFADQSLNSIHNHLLHNSDYYALTHLPRDQNNELSKHQNRIVDTCYRFAAENDFENHYEDYYEYEKNRGIDYGPERLDGNTRFECVSDLVGNLDAGATVLDYGCAHGHYTINLAKRFPKINFVGYDITQTNIDTARDWAGAEGLFNVTFHRRFVSDTGELEWSDENPSLIIAAEVIEHVADPQHLVGALISIAAPNALMVITTPYGPWEAQGYSEHHPWRAHIHHFERQDLHDIWAKFPEFNITVIPGGSDPYADVVGSYLTTFRAHDNGSHIEQGVIDYDRKMRLSGSRESASLCMITKDAGHIIGNAIRSVVDIVDEVIVGIDKASTDYTPKVLQNLIELYPLVHFEWFEIESPLESGFDAARNKTIARANGDWIIWLDADEEMSNSHHLRKYLRNSQYSGYSIKQHHFSVQPLGVLQTDLPVRVFRNHIGVQFYGIVHEHPEVEMNKGVGKAFVLPDVDIAHHGYDTEETRRRRFMRNIELMQRDRQENPDRILGKFLWIRDIAQSIQFALESGAEVNEGMYVQATEGITLWRDLMDCNTRMAQEALKYYSFLVSIARPEKALDYSFSVDAKPAGMINGEDPDVYKGTFFDKEHATAFFKKIEGEKMTNLHSRYL